MMSSEDQKSNQEIRDRLATEIGFLVKDLLSRTPHLSMIYKVDHDLKESINKIAEVLDDQNFVEKIFNSDIIIKDVFVKHSDVRDIVASRKEAVADFLLGNSLNEFEIDVYNIKRCVEDLPRTRDNLTLHDGLYYKEKENICTAIDNEKKAVLFLSMDLS